MSWWWLSSSSSSSSSSSNHTPRRCDQLPSTLIEEEEEEQQNLLPVVVSNHYNYNYNNNNNNNDQMLLYGTSGDDGNDNNTNDDANDDDDDEAKTTTTLKREHTSPESSLILSIVTTPTTTTTTTRILPFLHIVAILSTSFAYGCIFTTLFIITLPIECERIMMINIQQQQQQQQSSSMDDTTVTSGSFFVVVWSKSTLLGLFVAIAGITQLISPLIGYMSDHYIPPQLLLLVAEPPLSTPVSPTTTTSTNNNNSKTMTSTSSSLPSQSQPQYAEIGQRLPYYILGAIISTFGLLGQMFTSYSLWWIHYSFAYIFSMIGLNIQYAIMLSLLPDQISHLQMGIANGILAFLLVTGSIFGFTIFHILLYQNSIESMYGLYASMVILTSIITSLYAYERDAEISTQRIQQQQQLSLHECDQTQPQQQIDNVILHKDDSFSILPDMNLDLPISSHRRRRPPDNSTTSSSSSSSWHVMAGVVATQNAVRGAVQTAKQVLVLTPSIILRSMITPIYHLNYRTLIQCYTIDIHTNYNFFIITLSRLFYYCGMSIQTFFLYYIHDIILKSTSSSSLSQNENNNVNNNNNPETIVAILAMIGQCSGAITCYPVGIISDRLLQGRRKPFIYIACIILSVATFSMIYARTVNQMILICIVLGAANGMYLTAETSLAVDTLNADAANNNKNNNNDNDNNSKSASSEEEMRITDEQSRTCDHQSAGNAQLLGIWGVAAFVGSALGPLIGGPLLGAFGTTTTVSTPIVTHMNDSMTHHHHHHHHIETTLIEDVDTTSYTITGYTVILSLSSFYFICSALILQYLKVGIKKVYSNTNESE